MAGIPTAVNPSLSGVELRTSVPTLLAGAHYFSVCVLAPLPRPPGGWRTPTAPLRVWVPHASTRLFI